MQLRKLCDGDRSYKVAESYQNIATVMDYEGHLTEAEVLYHQALSIFTEQCGENSLLVALTLNNLGILYNSMGQLDKAEELLKKSLNIREQLKEHGSDESRESIDSEEETTVIKDSIATTQKNIEYVINKRMSLKRGTVRDF